MVVGSELAIPIDEVVVNCLWDGDSSYNNVSLLESKQRLAKSFTHGFRITL